MAALVILPFIVSFALLRKVMSSHSAISAAFFLFLAIYSERAMEMALGSKSSRVAPFIIRALQSDC